MTRGLWLIVKLSLIVVAAVWLAQQQGSVEITWAGYRVDTSIGFFIFVIVLLMGFAAIVDNIWQHMRGAGHAVMEWRRAGRRKRAVQALTKGLVALSTGDGRTALNQAQAVRKGLDSPVLADMLQAQAGAMLEDNETERQGWLALAKSQEAAIIGWRGMIEQAIRQGELAEARKLATRAHDLDPTQPWLLTTLADLQLRTGRWEAAEATLAEVEAQNALPRATARRRRAAAKLARAEEAAAEGKLDQAVTLGLGALELRPGFVAGAAKTALWQERLGKHKAARQTLEKAWQAFPHPTLTKTWEAVMADGDNDRARVNALKKLVDLDPNKAEARLALAERAIASRDWSTARSALEPIMAARPGAHALRLAAELAQNGDNDADRAAQLFKRAAEHPEAEPAWTCDSCGAVYAQWQRRCETCGSFDSLEWRAPIAGAAGPAPPTVTGAVPEAA